MEKRDLFVSEIIPALRIISSEKNLKTVLFSEDKNISITENSDYNSLCLKDDENIIDDFRNKIRSFDPNKATVIFIENKGFIIIADNSKECSLVSEFLKTKNEALLQKAKNLSNTHKGKAENKIIIVTGGAQGFGEGITRDLFEEGANIVIADINEAKAKELTDELNAKDFVNEAKYFKTDVSDPGSVEQLINYTVTQFGGLDIFISNAGILRAGGLEDMDDKTFDLMTKINYSAYYYCAKYASKVMKVQWRYDKNRFYDIIQINSKSGLKGSNKNFAYAGGKFGGIGLTESFALELMPFNIKVNSICPGNFFDGPLWSDPNNGLFVQYLKAGKVPGAKTIEEVKRFYEAQVPANRGCLVKDVMKAIYYAVDQEYETGQAIPVTGGQNMLK